MHSVPFRTILACVIASVVYSNSAPTAQEPCHLTTNDNFLMNLRNGHPLKVLQDELMVNPLERDGKQMVIELTKRVLVRIKELRRETALWSNYFDNIMGVKRGLQSVCRHYNNFHQIFPYKCYAEANWCTLHRLFVKIAQQLQTIWRPVERRLELTPIPPFGGFPPPGNDESRNALITEVKMACETFFYNPVLGSLTASARDNGPELKTRIINRMTYYISAGEIENLNAFLERFNWVKQPFSDASDSDENSLVHDMNLVFNAMHEIGEDMDSFTWNNRWPLPFLRSEIAMLWLLIPKWNHNLFPTLSTSPYAPARLRSFLQAAFDAVLEKNLDNLQSIVRHTENLKRRLSNDCSHHVAEEANSLECHILRVLEDTGKLVEEVQGSNWQNTKALDARSATLVHLLSSNVKEYIQVSLLNSRDIVLDVLKRLYSYSKQHDASILRNYMNLIPPMDSIGTEQGCSEYYVDLQSSLPCIFKSSFRQINLYMSSLNVPSSTTKIISTRYKFQEKLEGAQLSTISDQIDQRAIESKANLAEVVGELQQFLSVEIGTRFSALEHYFRGIAEFDQRKAAADVGFIEGRLKSFQDSLSELQPKLERQMVIIISAAFKSSDLQVFQQGIESIFKVITACNIADREVDFGAFFDIANDASQAIVNTARSSTLRDNYQQAFEQTSSVASRLAENSEFMRTVTNIVQDLPQLLQNRAEFSRTTSIFLSKYSDYDPKVQRQELTKIGTDWEVFLEEACNVIFDGGSVASSTVEVEVANKGDCIKTQGDISKMMEIFSEIYDYQYELMETLASAVRAYQSQFFANRLDTNLRVLSEQGLSTGNEYEVVSLHQAVLSFYLVNRIHTLEMLTQHCAYLQFRNAGELPPECQSALRTLEHREISHLHGLQVGRCSPELFKYVDIPIQKSNDDDSLGSINITKLYQGDSVSFRIPNFEWLETNGWVTGVGLRDTAIYISAFEIFLPSVQSNEGKKRKTKLFHKIKKGNHMTTVKGLSMTLQNGRETNLHSNASKNLIMRRSSGEEQEIHFTITAKYPAPLFPGDNAVKYSLQPYTDFAFGYKENSDSCRLKTINNPYSSSLPKLCLLSPPPKPNDANPSIFSLWNVKLETPPDSVPESNGNERLKAAVRMCKVRKPSAASKAKSNQKSEREED